MNDRRSADAERRPDRAALVIAALLLALAAVVAWETAHMQTGVATYSRIGPRAFPYGIAAGLALLGLLTAVQAFREPAADRKPTIQRPLPGSQAG